ncbi:SRPBCC family protein [Massilia violaceinigra]|uniref:SRPBCC family protein n=1 Tax=Massilia violaceinigra TaxID=2045208 RepID=A0ABY4A8C9_9BURK|nr:SRPBCC family protein [Massilia violaceinigra]UOD29909.1 SRPBCC family protein [Massilia violaceinigra]
MKQTSGHDLHLGKWLGGAALGALAMYMLDPDRGAPRRALSGAKLRDLGRQGGDMLEKVVHDVSERMGATGNSGPGGADGATMATTGQHRTEPASATTSDGDSARSFTTQSPWRPAPRNAMPGGGTPGLAGMLTRRMPLAMIMGAAGAALLLRSMRNGALPGLSRQQERSGMVDIEKSISIDAAPEQVYALWTSYDNFPRFMANVLEVRDLGNRRSHWVVKGPAGNEFSFDAVLIEQVRPHRLAWRSEPGAQVEQTGSVRLEPSRGGTLATVSLSYRPPAGAVGQAVATLFGGDPERELEEDLGRMKNLLEGTPTARAGDKSKEGPRSE